MNLIWAVSAAILSFLTTAQTPPPSTNATAVLVEKKVVSALSFEQCDLSSFRKAQSNFTPKALNEFMKTMQGFLDPSGAPTFTSKFAPVGGTAILQNDESTIKAKVPGTLDADARPIASHIPSACGSAACGQSAED